MRLINSLCISRVTREILRAGLVFERFLPVCKLFMVCVWLCVKLRMNGRGAKLCTVTHSN